MKRRIIATLAIPTLALILFNGCESQQDLSSLEVGENQQVATFKVVDGM